MEDYNVFLIYTLLLTASFVVLLGVSAASCYIYAKTKSNKAKFLFFFAILQLLGSARYFIFYPHNTEASHETFRILWIVGLALFYGVIPLAYLYAVNSYVKLNAKGFQIFKNLFAFLSTSLIAVLFLDLSVGDVLYIGPSVPDSQNIFLRELLVVLGGLPTNLLKNLALIVAISHLSLSIFIIKEVYQRSKDRLFAWSTVVTLLILLYGMGSWTIAIEIYAPVAFLTHILEVIRMVYISQVDLINETLASQDMNRQLAKIISESNIITKFDCDGKVTFANNKFCEVSGYGEKELIGKDHSTFAANTDHGEEFWIHVWEKLSKSKSWSGQIKYQTRAGAFFWTETQIFPVLKQNGKILEYISIQRDVTLEKQLLDQKMKDSRLRVIGETTSQIIHDTMNPLSVIEMSTQIAIERIKAKEQTDPLAVFEKIKRSTERIFLIFKRLRQSIISDDSVEIVNLKSLVDEAIEILEFKIQEVGAKIKVDGCLDLHSYGNKTQLLSVFTNLIKNSLDEFKVKEWPDKWIHIDLKNDQESAVLRFIDSGAGIPNNVQDQMWSSLFTTKVNDGGTGLGLGICKKIVEAHEGKIYVNNENKHTEFVIELKRVA